MSQHDTTADGDDAQRETTSRTSREIRDEILTTEDALYERYDRETAERLIALQKVYNPALGTLVMIREMRSTYKEYVGLHTSAALKDVENKIEQALPRLEEEAERILDDATEVDD